MVVRCLIFSFALTIDIWARWYKVTRDCLHVEVVNCAIVLELVVAMKNQIESPSF